jgi:hypothetical protein
LIGQTSRAVLNQESMVLAGPHDRAGAVVPSSSLLIPLGVSWRVVLRPAFYPSLG